MLQLQANTMMFDKLMMYVTPMMPVVLLMLCITTLSISFGCGKKKRKPKMRVAYKKGVNKQAAKVLPVPVKKQMKPMPMPMKKQEVKAKTKTDGQKCEVTKEKSPNKPAAKAKKPMSSKGAELGVDVPYTVQTTFNLQGNEPGEQEREEASDKAKADDAETPEPVQKPGGLIKSVKEKARKGMVKDDIQYNTLAGLNVDAIFSAEQVEKKQEEAADDQYAQL